jgi:hypothetical protein
MARKPTTVSSPKSKATRGSTPTGLALSDLQIRLDFLEKDNEKILKQISKKRTEIDNLLERIQELGRELALRSAPILQQLFEIDQQIHAVFVEIFNGRKLGKQTRKDIERVYRNLQNSGLLSPQLDSDGQPEKKGLFDMDDFPDFADAEDPEWYENQAASGFGDSAIKPDRNELKKIRQLFLKLADVFHPDKVGPDADKEYHAEVMKELNQAYQNGDLAKLLAIEKQHEMGEAIDRNNPDDLTRRCARIEKENEFLKSQFNTLKQELQLAKNSQEGTIVSEHRKMTKAGIDPIGEAVAEAEGQCQLIKDIYDFAVNFRDRRITIKEFMQGPPSIQRIAEEEIDIDELFMEFLEFSESQFR